MKYQSEIVKEIIDSRGHEKSSLHYQSECIETWIKESEGSYPKLCDYEGEWLNYINENPIGEFPYETLTDVTTATVNNVVPFAYKSATLKGSTKYRDIDTGDILDTFDETKNLELVSVKVPVLTTTRKNLFDGYLEKGWSSADGSLIDIDRTRTNLISVEKNETYTVSRNKKTTLKIDEFDGNFNFIKTSTYQALNATLITSAQTKYIRIFIAEPLGEVANHDLQLEKGNVATSYEPYKSNILTVNKDVTLRGVGDVRDELDCLTGELTERIGEIVLDGSEDESWSVDEPLINNYKFLIPLTNEYYQQGAIITTVISDKYPSINNGTTSEGLDVESICINGWSTESKGRLNLSISKTKLSNGTVNELREYLSQNPFTVQYQLATESIKTVELTTVNEKGETTNFKPLEGTMHLTTSSKTINPLFSGEIPVEAITQNLASFIDLETEE